MLRAICGGKNTDGEIRGKISDKGTQCLRNWKNLQETNNKCIFKKPRTQLLSHVKSMDEQTHNYIAEETDR